MIAVARPGVVVRLVLAFAALGAEARAQFSGPRQPPPFAIFDLASTEDGGQLYFSSTLRLKGTEQVGHAKLFRLAENGLELIAQRERTVIPSGNNTTNFFHIGETQVSADGTVLLYHLQRTCGCCSSCLGVEMWFKA